MLAKRLGAALRAFREPGSHPPARDDLEALAKRVDALEDMQTRRELEWAETKSSLDRMLRRAAALQSVDRARGEPGNGKMNRDQLREVLRAKGLLKGE